MAEHKKLLIRMAIIVTAIIAVIVGAFVLMFSSHKYVFLHSTDEIEKVEIIKNNDDPDIRHHSLPNDYTVLKDFSPEEQETFIEEIRNLECYTSGNDFNYSLDDFLVKITYENGDLEYLGSSSTAFYSYSKKDVDFTFQYFDDDDFIALLSKYTELK